MKKLLLMAASIWLALGNAFAEKASVYEKFYVPEKEEVNYFFNLALKLMNYNPASQKESDDFFNSLFEVGLNYPDLMQNDIALLYIRNTSNQFVKNTYDKFYNKNKEKLPEKYKTVYDELENCTFMANEMLLRNIPDGNRMDYYTLVQAGFLNNKIFTTFPGDSGWNKITETKNTMIIENSVHGEKLTLEYDVYSEKEKKYNKRISDSSKKAQKGTVLISLDPDKGFLSICNAAKINVMLEEKLNDDDSKSFIMSDYLYSGKSGETYVIKWTMTFEKSSSFYEDPECIVSYLSKLMLFSWIEN